MQVTAIAPIEMISPAISKFSFLLFEYIINEIIAAVMDSNVKTEKNK